MTLKKQIAVLLEKTILKKFNYQVPFVSVNYPENSLYGDYASPIAMSLAKPLRKSPREIANTLATILQSEVLFEKIEVAGPGFLNFFLKQDYLVERLNEILTTSSWAVNDTLKNQRIMLEYVSANPTGPLHIGHGRWAAIGDSLSRVMKISGAEVWDEFYVNDAGNQINLLNVSVEAVRKGQNVPENGYHGDYIQEVADQNEEPKKVLQSRQQHTLESFGVHFDRYFSELSLHNAGYVEETMEWLIEKNLAYKKEGALWFRTTDFGDDKDRVLVKMDGSYTYYAVDIAYHRNKVDRKEHFTRLINVLGADHHGYVKRMQAALKMINPDVKFEILIGQLVSLFRNGEPVRMSKRTGEMISLREVMNEIGVDATRYFLVMRNSTTALDFDLEVAKKKSEDNPVFYVQYAHARTAGVLRNAKEQGISVNSIQVSEDFFESGDYRTTVLELLKFPEVVSDVALSCEPHRIPAYLENLSGVFHRFYHNNRVLTDNEQTSKGRLFLVKAVRKVLAEGLSLIGVSAPDRM